MENDLLHATLGFTGRNSEFDGFLEVLISEIFLRMLASISSLSSISFAAAFAAELD